MTRRMWWLASGFLILSGCSGQELQALRSQIAGLEQELQAARAEVDETARQTVELRAKLEEQQAVIEAMTRDLVRVKVERDKLKQEVRALKKRR